MSKIQPNTTPTGMNNVTGQGPDEIKALRPPKGVGLDQNIQERLLTSPRLLDERFAASLSLNAAAETGHGASKSAAATQEMNKNLNSLFSSPAASDGVLTWSEVVDMATRQGDPAAKWLMDNRAFFNELPTKAGKHGAIGLDIASIRKQVSEGTIAPPAPKTPETEQGASQGQAPKSADAQYESAVAARNAIIAENATVAAHNRPIQEQIAANSLTIENIEALMAHIDFRDKRFSWSEIENLATRSTTVKEAARWVLDNWNSFSKNWAGDITSEELLRWISSLRKKNTELSQQLRTERPVPPEPTPPSLGTAPGGAPPPGNASPPGNPSPPGNASPQPGTNQAPITGDGGQPTKPPELTPSEFRAKSLKNSIAYGEFSSTATTPDGRMQDGLRFCQGKLDALQNDLVEAGARGDQAAISLINAEIAKFQAGLSALMQMMKQQQEMLSNMSKMFNEMAMSSIRNMR
ncbi:MAG: hypothetical protein SFW67_31985 [Myxococcaceae bacterium]|nr:hypothetical protein [Myxococcaceae bacterium]